MNKPEPFWTDIAVITGKICPYCNVETKLVNENEIYGQIVFGRQYFQCTANPDHYVGCYRSKGIKSLGRVSNVVLRALKMRCHVLFDRGWEYAVDKHGARIQAYHRLSERFGIPHEYCHFGMMDEAWCVYIINTFSQDENPRPV